VFWLKVNSYFSIMPNQTGFANYLSVEKGILEPKK